jgi:hypothetical protein
VGPACIPSVASYYRNVTTPPQFGGALCPVLYRLDLCNRWCDTLDAFLNCSISCNRYSCVLSCPSRRVAANCSLEAGCSPVPFPPGPPPNSNSSFPDPPPNSTAPPTRYEDPDVRWFFYFLFGTFGGLVLLILCLLLNARLLEKYPGRYPGCEKILFVAVFSLLCLPCICVRALGHALCRRPLDDIDVAEPIPWDPEPVLPRNMRHRPEGTEGPRLVITVSPPTEGSE